MEMYEVKKPFKLCLNSFNKGERYYVYDANEYVIVLMRGNNFYSIDMRTFETLSDYIEFIGDI